LDLAGHDQTVNALAGYPNTSSNIGPDSSRYVTNSAAAGTNTLTVGNGGGSATFKGVIVDGANAKVALTKSGTGTETLNSPCTYSGPTAVTGGTLVLAASSSLSTNTTLSISSNATFDVVALTTGNATYTFAPASLSASGMGSGSAVAAKINGTAGGTVLLGATPGATPIILTWNGPSSGSQNGIQSLIGSGASLTFNTNQITVVVLGAPLTTGNYQLAYDQAGILGSVNPTPLYTGGNGVATNYTGKIAFAGTNNLYLYVTLNTYTVTYATNNATSGTAPVDSNTYTNGQTVTVLGNTGTLARTGYTLAGWNTASDGTGTSYAATGSASFNIGPTSVKLWPVWTLSAPSPAHLTNSVLNGNHLVLSWPTGQGWVLQSNSVSLTDTNAWFPVTGATPPFTNNVDSAQPTVFFRLKY
jgi:autotransporter-associated beta strand protein